MNSLLLVLIGMTPPPTPPLQYLSFLNKRSQLAHRLTRSLATWPPPSAHLRRLAVYVRGRLIWLNGTFTPAHQRLAHTVISILIKREHAGVIKTSQRCKIQIVKYAERERERGRERGRLLFGGTKCFMKSSLGLFSISSLHRCNSMMMKRFG